MDDYATPQSGLLAGECLLRTLGRIAHTLAKTDHYGGRAFLVHVGPEGDVLMDVHVDVVEEVVRAVHALMLAGPRELLLCSSSEGATVLANPATEVVVKMGKSLAEMC